MIWYLHCRFNKLKAQTTTVTVYQPCSLLSWKKQVAGQASRRQPNKPTLQKKASGKCQKIGALLKSMWLVKLLYIDAMSVPRYEELSVQIIRQKEVWLSVC